MAHKTQMTSGVNLSITSIVSSFRAEKWKNAKENVV